MGKTLVYIFAFLLVPFIGESQVTISKDVSLTGTLDEDRQVLGVSSAPTDTAQAVNVEIIQSNYLKFSNATGNGNDISLTIPLLDYSYTEGISLYILTNNENTGNVTIEVNNLGVVPLYKNISDEIEPGEIANNQVIHVIYDGNAFQILNDLIKKCPSGFTQANKNYCIEIDERTPAIYYDAIIACGDIGAKLCSWDDWYYACQDAQISLEINDEIGNWEWLDEGGNNISTAQSATNTTHITGETGCKDRFTGPIKLSSDGTFVSLPYRCCYNTK